MAWIVNRSRRRIERGVYPLKPMLLREADAIVTTNEVTDRHGTGVLLRRIFGTSPNLLSIRSSSLYPEHQLGVAHLQFGHEGLSRSESFARVAHALNGSTVRRILCVPFLPDEVLTAIALKEMFNAPLCMYLMDDNNVFSRGIADELLREALSKANLRLAISPEMRDAYEDKYGLNFWVLPPVVRPEAVCTRAGLPQPELLQSRSGVLVGSLWSRRWLERLRAVVKASGLTLDWYGNATAPWLKVTRAELRRDGIIDAGFVPEAELTVHLQRYAYAVIPSGSLDGKDDRPEIARLSLPTRMPFLLAAANMPMIVLGSSETAAAGFLKRFCVGRVSPYDGQRLREAVEEVCRPEAQAEFRHRAATHSRLFSAGGLADWIWHSLDLGEACDARFERAFGRAYADSVVRAEPPAPADVVGENLPVYTALRRLKRQGFAPDFVMDIGASWGNWSHVAKRIFPQARFILIEPLQPQFARGDDRYLRPNPEFEYVPVAISDAACELESLRAEALKPTAAPGGADVNSPRLPVRTLDEVAREKKLVGRGLLKLDARFAEELVLEGARELMGRVDALAVGVSLVRNGSRPMRFLEMSALLERLGFAYYDDLGAQRVAGPETAVHKSVLFVREELLTQGQDPVDKMIEEKVQRRCSSGFLPQ